MLVVRRTLTLRVFLQYNRVADLERREALERLLARTAGAEASEAAELAAAAEVEARRKAEVDAARAAGLPLPAFCRPAGRFPELRISMEDLDVSEEPPGPELPTPRGQSTWPAPGAYARGVHTTAVAPEALAAAAIQAPGGRQRDKKALEGINKRVDLAMEELGVRPPHTATRAVCRAWFALRTEVLQLLEVRLLSSLQRFICPFVSDMTSARAAAGAAGAQEQGAGGCGCGCRCGGDARARRCQPLLQRWRRRHGLALGACLLVSYDVACAHAALLHIAAGVGPRHGARQLRRRAGLAQR